MLYRVEAPLFWEGGPLPLPTVLPPCYPLPLSIKWSINWMLFPPQRPHVTSILTSLPPLPLFSGSLPHPFLLGIPSHQSPPHHPQASPLLAPAQSLRFGRVSTPDLYLPLATQRLSLPVTLLRVVHTLSPCPYLHSSNSLPSATPLTSS